MNTSILRPSRAPRVAVVGGGLIGLSIGWRLLAQGYAVTLFERGAPGSGASWAAAGMLSVVGEAETADRDFFNLCRASRARWPAFAAELEAITGKPLPLGDRGTLLVARDAADERGLRELANAHAGSGTMRLIAHDEWRRMEPWLSEDVQAVNHAPEDSYTDNRVAVSALAHAFLKSGGELRADAEVKRLIVRGGRIIGGVDTSGGSLPVDYVVLAAGVGTTALLAASGLQGIAPDVTPVKGQMIAFDMNEEAPDLTHVVRSADVYLVPRPSGRLIAGATSEPGVWDTSLTTSARDELHRAAAELVPALAKRPIVDHWAGLRPLIAGGRPCIGPTEVAGLLVAIGHYRNGVLLTPITADIIAGMIAGTLTAADAALAAPFGVAGLPARSPQPAVL